MLAGSNLNLDLALDVAYAVKTLIYPDLKLTGFASHEEAVAELAGRLRGDHRGRRRPKNGVPAILLTAALVDAPTKTRTYDGSTIESQVRARAESILTALGYGTYGRYEIEQRVGGNASGNDERRLRRPRQRGGAVADRDACRPARPTRCSTSSTSGERVTADETARAEFDTHGQPDRRSSRTRRSRCTRRPTRWCSCRTRRSSGDRVYAADGRTATWSSSTRCRRRPTRPRPARPTAPGHCNFTTEQRVGVVKLLDSWVRDGTVPGSASIATYFPGDESVVSHYTPARGRRRSRAS